MALQYFEWKARGVIDDGASGRWWWMIWNDGGGKAKVWGSGSRSLQRCNALMDMARLGNLGRVVTGDGKRLRQRACRMVKSLQG